MNYRKWAAVPLALACASGIVWASTVRNTPDAIGQIVPGPPTTPQPTVPCIPGDACGRAGGTQRDVGFAWIDRYCNGDAVPTPVGFTTFALNYGLGGQSLSPAQFSGTATVDGVLFPTAPLDLLQPGEKDTRIRAVVIPDNAVVEFIITGVSINTGEPLIFGNGTDTRIRSASGACPAAPAVPTPVVPGAPLVPVPEAPPIVAIPPAL